MGDQFRQRLRDERERRGWSRAALTVMLEKRGVWVHPTAIAKIENGTRSVELSMLWALADIFGVSVDALIGRAGRGGDLAWAASKLTANAQKAASEIDMIAHRLRTEYDEVWAMLGRESTSPLLEVGGSALMQLSLASSALNDLANQFPLPTAG